MNKLNRFLYIFLLLSFFSLNSNCVFSQTNKANLDKLDAYIDVAYVNWEIPGMAIAIVKDGKIVFAKGYGIKEYGVEDKVDENTLFAIASNTKSFTTAGLSILVDEGKIKWDDKVIDYLPYFKMYDDYVTKEMTIRDLLCHRSGLETFSGDLLWYGSTYSREEVINRASLLEPAYGFRSHYGYSNIMFLAAGQIIESVTGIKWEDFIQQSFLDPLKMNSTYTSIKQFKKDDNLAMPHHVEIGAKPIVLNYLSWDNIAPAGSVISSVNDMSKWLIFQLNNGINEGDTILSEEVIWEMRSPQTIEEIGSWSSNYWASKHFEAYGLGWSMFDFHGKKIVNHGGGADGMISQTVLIPEENMGFVILTNSINYLPTSLMYYILDMYLDKNDTDWSEFYLNYFKYSKKQEKNEQIKEEDERDKNTKPTIELSEYCGIYTSELYGDADVKLESGKLVMYFIPTPMFIGDLSHWEKDTFKIELRNIYNLPYGKVKFILDENKKVTELQVDIPNPDFDFTELKFYKKD
jgi:CubicO group peptidase (beta-lactamase class C family)